MLIDEIHFWESGGVRALSIEDHLDIEITGEYRSGTKNTRANRIFPSRDQIVETSRGKNHVPASKVVKGLPASAYQTWKEASKQEIFEEIMRKVAKC